MQFRELLPQYTHIYTLHVCSAITSTDTVRKKYLQQEVWDGDKEDVINLPTGTTPLQDMYDPMEAIDVGSLQIFLRPGEWRVRCRCEGEFKGTSKDITVDYVVLKRADPPEIFTNGGLCLYLLIISDPQSRHLCISTLVLCASCTYLLTFQIVATPCKRPFHSVDLVCDWQEKLAQ